MNNTICEVKCDTESENTPWNGQRNGRSLVLNGVKLMKNENQPND